MQIGQIQFANWANKVSKSSSSLLTIHFKRPPVAVTVGKAFNICLSSGRKVLKKITFLTIIVIEFQGFDQTKCQTISKADTTNIR